MRSRLAGVVALFGALFMVIGTGLTLTAAAAADDHKVLVCHAAGGSGTYSPNDVDKNSVINESAHGGSAHLGDIIKPFTGFVGRNWPEGQAIYDNGCKVPSGPEPDTDVEVTPVEPTSSDPCGTSDDSYTVPATTGVDYLVGGSVVSDGNHPGSASVTVSAEAQDGYVLTGASSWTFDFTDVACEQPDEDESVTAKAPSSTDPCGTSDDSYTVPATTGVDYLVGGSVVSDGTHPGSASVTVSAEAQDGYVLTGGSSWTFDFTDDVCEQKPGEEKPGDDTPPADKDDKDPAPVTDPVSDDPKDKTHDGAKAPAVDDSKNATGSKGSSDDKALPAAAVAGGDVPTAVDAGLSTGLSSSSASSAGMGHGQVGLGLLGLGLAFVAIGGLLRTGQRRECLR